MKVEKHTARGRVGEAVDEVLAGDTGKRKLMSVGIRGKRGKRRMSRVWQSGVVKWQVGTRTRPIPFFDWEFE
jgi:hypothetical protein